MFSVICSAVEVPPGFVAETVATNLNCVTALAPLPDGRILIADQTGPVLLWKDAHTAPQPALDLSARLDTHWERGVIGLALHPRFPADPRVYVLYVAAKPHTRHVLSSFTLKGDTLDAASEKVLLEGDDQALLGGNVKAGHQGGPLRFGPDGLLYVGLGEQTAGQPSQQLETLQGKILRLRDDGTIPDTNPFAAQTTGKYRSIYARGIRNPFGIAVQPETGRLFFTDVGGSAFEEINELTAGANYGWPLAEGRTQHKEFAQPLHAYPPVIGSSIVGGAFVPRSSQWPEKWRGKLLVADFMKHWVKLFDPGAPEKLTSFGGGLHGPVALEFAADGSLLVLNRGTIWRDPKKVLANSGSLLRIRWTGALPEESTLAGNGALGLPLTAAALPEKLTAADWRQRLTGARSVTLRTLAWTPPMTGSTRVYFPATGRAAITATGELDLPDGTVFVREFSHDGQLVERRIALLAAGAGWAAAWKLDARGDGELVPDGEFLDTPRGVWFIPLTEVTLTRPIMSFMHWLPLTAAEWNVPAEGENETPLAALHRMGLLAAAPSPAPTAAAWNDETAAPELRVRTWLHVHCAACHQPGGPSRGQFDARLTTSLENSGLLNAPPIAGDLGVADAKLVTPGVPDKSILLRRLKDTGFFRMPPVAFHTETAPIIPVLEQWLRELAPDSARRQD